MPHPLNRTNNLDVLRGTALRVLGLILSAGKGQMPSCRELASAVGVNYTAVFVHLRRLHAGGLISRGDFREYRTVRPTCVFVPASELFPED